MKKENYVKLEFESISENISFARVVAASFVSQLDFTLPDIEEIKVAVSEAVTNVVLHAYEDNGPVFMEMKLVDEDKKLIDIIIYDKGRGIPDINKAREASYTTIEGRMGFGFVFMESFSDTLEVSSTPGEGTLIHMTKTPDLAGEGD